MIARRIQHVQDPVIPIVGRWTRQHPGTISLGQGVVHFPPPPQVFQAVSQAAQHDRSLDRYGDVSGSDGLIELIRDKLVTENEIDLVAQQSTVVVTAGANMGFLNAILAIADVDDEIILLAPYYFNHQMAIEIAGCRPVVVPTLADHQPDLDAIADAMTPRTKAIVTVSPNNPTGTVYSPQDLNSINQLCARQGIYHVCDEAYEYFLYDGLQHYSPGSRAGAGRHTISLFSLSKTYGMAGWRVGYCVVPNHLVDAIKKIQDTNLICPPIVCQTAASAALTVGADWCRDQIGGLNAVRDASLESLSVLGGKCHQATPQGAFYLFLHLQTDRSDMQLVEQLIRDFGVAVLPGSAFGVTQGCCLRASYGALQPSAVVDGVGRLCKGLQKLL
ncbi:pyridoxal phosphate-dependent aminotransferase [Stieleria sp. TO1_6]|uniref:pyridoxal phosphate-dependent aminotransferase n=1 Tax=Stieleria tagensis TaxID=2956795 RepID=UPI00209AE4CA|nr:pyridoxal phosphate-dependent aminotransferase [Stieleria tagensis]MCO8124436.1 pyridoxal phosphate-dependent aminotransferase [Stieleria tagensis]